MDLYRVYEIYTQSVIIYFLHYIILHACVDEKASMEHSSHLMFQSSRKMITVYIIISY